MGSSASHFPASTPTVCVLPLRTYGSSRFSLPDGPMPACVSSRLSEAEYTGLIDTINTALRSLSHFALASLLIPFLVVDLITMALLCAFDPGLLLFPWDYSAADLTIPILLEFVLFFSGFPVMFYVINRRVDQVQQRVRTELDAASRKYGPRGVNFQFRQGIVGSGASTNMWVELAVLPMIQVSSECANSGTAFGGPVFHLQSI